jgi:hypothetical protein
MVGAVEVKQVQWSGRPALLLSGSGDGQSDVAGSLDVLVQNKGKKYLAPSGTWDDAPVAVSTITGRNPEGLLAELPQAAADKLRVAGTPVDISVPALEVLFAMRCRAVATWQKVGGDLLPASKARNAKGSGTGPKPFAPAPTNVPHTTPVKPLTSSRETAVSFPVRRRRWPAVLLLLAVAGGGAFAAFNYEPRVASFVQEFSNAVETFWKPVPPKKIPLALKDCTTLVPVANKEGIGPKEQQINASTNYEFALAKYDIYRRAQAAERDPEQRLRAIESFTKAVCWQRSAYVEKVVDFFKAGMGRDDEAAADSASRFASMQ